VSKTRLQMVTMLVVGALLGSAAASGELDLFGTGDAAPPSTLVGDKPADPKHQAPVPKAEGQNSEKPAQDIIKAEPTPSRAKWAPLGQA
jgi:hypothetical protein